MRLTCPNCKAQYEVDDAVIPDNGRDVQCSACAHTWYQYPVGIARPAHPPALDEPDSPPDAPAPGAVPRNGDATAEPAETEAAAEAEAEAEAEGARSPAPPPAATAAPRIDQSVLDVLREEAARELDERRRSGMPIETQGDLGLVSRPRRRSRTEQAAETADESGQQTAGADPDAHAAPGQPARGPSRRNLLPDIDELSSTLEPGREPRRKGAAETALPPTEDDERRGFRQGFILALTIAIVLAGLYALAPMIGARVPALALPLEGYVALVDSLHAALRDAVESLVTRMRGTG